MTKRNRFPITFFADVYGQDLIDKEMSLDELLDLVLSTTARQKSALPLLALATFGIERNAKSNSLRHKANVLSVSGIEGDCDDQVTPVDRAVELLSQARLKALVYTSPSYVASAPKWRVILPTSQDLPPSEREKLVARVNGVLGGVLADESFVLSQSYYYGSVNNNPDHRAVIVQGDYVDERADLDVTAKGKKKTTADGADQPRRDDVETLKQADPDFVFAAMAVTPNGDDVMWPQWNSRGMACWLATNGHERGREAFDMWSRKSSKYDGANTHERWQHYFTSPPSAIGAGTIFKLADEAQFGWRALVGLPIEKITEVLRLAKLPPVAYDAERREVAKQWDIRVATLDAIVSRLSSRMTLNDDDDDKQGTRFEFATFEPWPDAVDGATLIDDMTRDIRSHVILAPHQALAVALRIIHTHAVEVSDHSPRLQIRSPTIQCGKSTLIDTVAAMVPKSLPTQNISTSALFRIIEMSTPTLLIDEADNFFKNSDGGDNRDTLGILNSGHKRNGYFIRAVGEDFEPRTFKTFAPIAFAWLVKRGTGVVTEGLESRCITIELRRKLLNEEITRLRSTRTGHLHQLGRRVARWVTDHKSSLVDANPSLPEQLNDREQDNWRPLITIADAMSIDLGQTARDAAIKIASENIGGDDDAGSLLLADVAAIIKNDLLQGRPPENVKGVASNYLVSTLVNMQDRPWKEWKRGSPLTEHSLSKLLKPFSLRPKKMRIGGNPTRGYVPVKVLEAAKRYVKEETDEVEEDVEDDPM